MKANESDTEAVWQKTPFANLFRYVPSGKYFARLRIRGKLIRRSLKTRSMTVAMLRLADLEKEERQRSEVQHNQISFHAKSAERLRKRIDVRKSRYTPWTAPAEPSGDGAFERTMGVKMQACLVREKRCRASLATAVQNRHSFYHAR